MTRFDPGASIALREVWRGRVWAARAATVVADDDDQVRLWVPVGTTWFGATRGGEPERIPRPDYDLTSHRYDEASVLSFAWPGEPHAALLFFRPDGTPWNWYVNLQDRLERTAIGFDTMDRTLDAIVELDGSWRWKDEDELEESIERGVLTREDEHRLRDEGERVVRRIVEREPPFDRDWTTWRPDPAWPAPHLPDGWDRV